MFSVLTWANHAFSQVLGTTGDGENSEKRQVCVRNTAGEGWKEQRERSKPRKGSERMVAVEFPLGMQI